tara:strand:- start:5677 stop:6036 length:360 start_codon:yes stop_codon:yes gene_type:complete
MKIYCSSCGAGTSYSMQKPNFCSGCGKPYIASAAKTKPVRKVIEQTIEEDYNDEDNFQVGIDSLEFDFKSFNSNVHRLGDIVGSATEGDAGESRERDASYTKTNIEKDFLNDAGSIKKF